MLAVILVGISGCATLGLGSPATPAYRPEIPARPMIEATPMIGLCTYGNASEREEPCIAFLLRDYVAIRQWYLALETEAKAACLALGWDRAVCRAEEEAPTTPPGKDY